MAPKHGDNFTGTGSGDPDHGTFIRERGMFNFIVRVEVNPNKFDGQPFIRGTQIRVSHLLDQIAAGKSWDTLLKEYPELQEADLHAALFYGGYIKAAKK